MKARSCRSGRRSARPSARCCMSPKVAVADPRRLRGRRRHLADVQRPHRRGLLRARADPARLRGRLLRPRRSPLCRGGLIGRAAFGTHPFLTLPAFQLVSTWEYPLYAGLGLLGGLAGSPSSASSTAPKTSWTGSGTAPNGSGPPPAELLLGLLLLALPQLYGVGYPPLENAVPGNIVSGSCSSCSSARWSPPA